MRGLIFVLLLTGWLSGLWAEQVPEMYLAQSNIRDQKTGEVTPEPRAGGLSGFAEVPWKSKFSEVKARFKNLSAAAIPTDRIEIITEEKNKSILVRRNDVLYRYNFYRTPFEVARLANHELKEEEYEQQEAQLYHVQVTFTPIARNLIGERIEKSHGAKTKSTVSDKTLEGADVWELPGGLILQWVQPYKKLTFTRTVDFLSDELAKQIMKEYQDYFDAREKWILKNILLY